MSSKKVSSKNNSANGRMEGQTQENICTGVSTKGRSEVATRRNSTPAAPRSVRRSCCGWICHILTNCYRQIRPSNRPRNRRRSELNCDAEGNPSNWNHEKDSNLVTSIDDPRYVVVGVVENDVYPRKKSCKSCLRKIFKCCFSPKEPKETVWEIAVCLAAPPPLYLPIPKIELVCCEDSHSPQGLTEEDDQKNEDNRNPEIFGEENLETEAESEEAQCDDSVAIEQPTFAKKENVAQEELPAFGARDDGGYFTQAVNQEIPHQISKNESREESTKTPKLKEELEVEELTVDEEITVTCSDIGKELENFLELEIAELEEKIDQVSLGAYPREMFEDILKDLDELEEDYLEIRLEELEEKIDQLSLAEVGTSARETFEEILKELDELEPESGCRIFIPYKKSKMRWLAVLERMKN